MNKNVVGLGLLFVAVGLLLSDDKPTDKTIPHKKGESKPQPTPKTFNNKKEELQHELNILKQKKSKTKKDRDNIDLIEVVLKSM
jgi:hypothetical protein